jgi:hypothetical protein
MAERLFVPLASEPFQWFRSGTKRWELRRHGRQYTRDHVVEGRPVELRRGYRDAGGALHGVVGQVQTAPSVAAFFARVPYEEVVPSASCREDAVAIAARILAVEPDSPVEVIGFRVEFRS